MSSVFIFPSLLGELRVDDVAELRGSLTSMPLSCWSFLSYLRSVTGILTIGGTTLLASWIRFSHALTRGMGAGMGIAMENGRALAAAAVPAVKSHD